MNNNGLFKNSDVIEAGISNHHGFIITALMSHLLKENGKTKL